MLPLSKLFRVLTQPPARLKTACFIIALAAAASLAPMRTDAAEELDTLRPKGFTASILGSLQEPSPTELTQTGFAFKLFRDGDYFRSLSEADRLFVLNPSDRFLLLLSSSSAYFSENLSYLERLSKARNIPSQAKIPVYKLASLSSIKAGNREEAKHYWERAGETSETFAPEPRNELDPEEAAWRSTVIPGWGLFYTGEYARGTGSFILNAVFIGLAINSFQHQNYGAALLFSLFEWQWYKGGIFAASESAENLNNNKKIKESKAWIAKIEKTIFTY